MTPAEFNGLTPDNQKIVYVLLEILRELKGINRQVEQIEGEPQLTR